MALNFLSKAKRFHFESDCLDLFLDYEFYARLGQFHGQMLTKKVFNCFERDILCS